MNALQAREKQAAEGVWGKAPWNCIRIVSRSRLAARLSLCVCLSGFVALGFLEMLSQYLELKLDYTKLDLVSPPILSMILVGLSGRCFGSKEQ